MGVFAGGALIATPNPD